MSVTTKLGHVPGTIAETTERLQDIHAAFLVIMDAVRPILDPNRSDLWKAQKKGRERI